VKLFRLKESEIQRHLMAATKAVPGKVMGAEVVPSDQLKVHEYHKTDSQKTENSLVSSFCLYSAVSHCNSFFFFIDNQRHHCIAPKVSLFGLF
jgi:hypothetical protein